MMEANAKSALPARDSQVPQSILQALNAIAELEAVSAHIVDRLQPALRPSPTSPPSPIERGQVLERVREPRAPVAETVDSLRERIANVTARLQDVAMRIEL